ncbi:hypothetical protein E2C01_068413 [Portunus trituberculatus]|uniref:Uncharacterized protein n=1 Tax=Portunus trituberculatus TaxID=210409 RepID=A0A5B7HZD4_PORTR|nr:hypothetical protein [Portunus trituberculatus]
MPATVNNSSIISQPSCCYVRLLHPVVAFPKTSPSGPISSAMPASTNTSFQPHLVPTSLLLFLAPLAPSPGYTRRLLYLAAPGQHGAVA